MNNYFVFFALVLGFICSMTNSQSADTDSEAPQNSCPDFCSLKPDSGTRGKTPFRRWYYDSELKECKKFSYGGRGGNQNRFLVKDDCVTSCGSCNFATDNSDVCSLSMDPGRCDEAGIVPTLSWYFDPESDTCQPFAYSGCGGNENKFDSQSKCQEICDK